MICHMICNTGVTCGAVITYSSGEPGVTPLSSYMICHRICKTGATNGANITYSSGEPGVAPLSSYMICHMICKTGATSGAGITYASGEPGVSLGFWGVRVVQHFLPSMATMLHLTKQILEVCIRLLNCRKVRRHQRGNL